MIPLVEERQIRPCSECAFIEWESDACRLGGYLETNCKYHITPREYMELIDSGVIP